MIREGVSWARRDLLACPVPTYTLYDTLVRIQGGKTRRGSRTRTTTPSPGALPRKRRGTIVANPNSPSGTAVPVRALAEARRPRPGCCVRPRGVRPTSADETALARSPGNGGNVIVLRTLSKSFSLGGMRIGLGFCSPPDHRGAGQGARLVQPEPPVRSQRGGRARGHRMDGAERGRGSGNPRGPGGGPSRRSGFTPFRRGSNFILARRTREDRPAGLRGAQAAEGS